MKLVISRKNEIVEEIKELRRDEYTRVADPVFFKWQRGEATEGDYLAAIQSVKDKYPYPEWYQNS